MTKVKQRYPTYAVAFLCSLFGKSRHAYYDALWRERDEILKDEIVLKSVKDIRNEQPKIGTRKLHHLLCPILIKHQISISRDELFTLLDRHKMLIRKRKKKAITTDSRHWMHKYPNLIKDLVFSAPCQLWVSDITYIRVGIGFCYLSLITDAYSHKIVGYALHKDLSSQGPIIALEMAISQRQNHSYILVHHSDRGSQYCSREYVELLLKAKIAISMTQNGDPYENAIAERINGILKQEFGMDKTYANYKDACLNIETSIKIYNEKRPHLSCNLLTPQEAERQNGVLKKRWKKYLKNQPI